MEFNSRRATRTHVSSPHFTGCPQESFPACAPLGPDGAHHPQSVLVPWQDWRGSKRSPAVTAGPEAENLDGAGTALNWTLTPFPLGAQEENNIDTYKAVERGVLTLTQGLYIQNQFFSSFTSSLSQNSTHPLWAEIVCS